MIHYNDYADALHIANSNESFEVMIMTAMLLADERNLAKLQLAWPAIYDAFANCTARQLMQLAPIADDRSTTIPQGLFRVPITIYALVQADNSSDAIQATKKAEVDLDIEGLYKIESIEADKDNVELATYPI